MTPGDHDKVIALWRAAPGIGLSASDECPAIAAYLARNAGMSFVALARGRIVGAILGGHDGRRGTLHHLAVRPAWRRRGIGRALVVASLARLAAAGIPKCNLFLFDHNAAGRAFWEKTGWTARADLVVMQQPLAGADAS